MERFDYKGVWWLPNNPTEKLSGICSFTLSEGGDLELIGDFSTLVDFHTSNEPLIILGSTLKGEITLYDCFLKEKNKRHGGIEISLYCVNLVFSGIHFNSDSEVKFKSISTHYSLTNAWVNTKTFSFRYSEDEDQLIYKGWNQLAQTNIDSDYSLSVGIACGQSVSLFEQITVDRKVFLTIEAIEEKHYKKYRKVMAHVRNFLTLGITKPVFPLIMTGIISRDDRTIAVSIIGKISSSSTDFLNSNMSWDDMFFTFKDIFGKFELLIKNWFKKAEDLGTVYELYFGVLENADLYYPQQEFLSLIQALESYCQKDLNPELRKLERPEEEHLRMLDSIVTHAPEEYQGWLKSKLKNSNSLSLNAKLMSLLKSESFREIFKHLKKSENAFNIFLDGRLRDAFVNGIVKARNQLSHGSGYDGDVYGKEFGLHIQRLKVLVEILLLKELGFGKEDIGVLLLRSRVGLRISQDT
jgi:ApeA N-terminal domain 1